MDRKEINIIECQAQQFKITIHKEKFMKNNFRNANSAWETL